MMTLRADKDLREALRKITRFVRGEVDVDIDSVDGDLMNLVSRYLDSRGRELKVRASDLAGLLKRYVDGKVSAEQLSRWGGFVYYGFPPWNKHPLRLPLPISYEEEVEDLISDVVSDMEQIGDVVDGDFTPERALSYLRELEGFRAARRK